VEGFEKITPFADVCKFFFELVRRSIGVLLVFLLSTAVVFAKNNVNFYKVHIFHYRRILVL